MDYLVYSFSALSGQQVPLEPLPPHDQAVAARRGERYARIRTLLRQELSRRSGIPAGDITFTYSEHGKPEFAAQPFNISHSGDCLCMAFHHRCVGVDVERMRPRHFKELAARFMCPEQYEAFLANNCPIKEFYSCWCATEALVKHAGDTVWHAQHYPFVYTNGRIRCLFEGAPTIELFSPMPGYQGAIAYTI